MLITACQVHPQCMNNIDINRQLSAMRSVIVIPSLYWTECHAFTLKTKIKIKKSMFYLENLEDHCWSNKYLPGAPKYAKAILSNPYKLH